MYAELPLTWGLMGALDTLASERAAGVRIAPKFRTGGLAAELFPTPGELAAVICACRDRELPFKLTAGLHHALRHTDPETGFTHHGFLNVLAADLVAAGGAEVDEVAEVLSLTDPSPGTGGGGGPTGPCPPAVDRVRLVQRRGTSGRPGASCGLPVRRLTRERCWVAGADGSGFGVDHLPYGVVTVAGEPRLARTDRGPGARPGRGGGRRAGRTPVARCAASDLNAFLAAGPVGVATGPAATDRTVHRVAAPRPRWSRCCTRSADVELLPFEVADYVDFYSSEHHATNVGQIFRPDQPPLLPNWKHLPIGYHGRAGTVVVSGTPIVRPSGQRRPPGRRRPVYGPVDPAGHRGRGRVRGRGTERAGPAGAGGRFAEHVFGVVLVNDWSARDIQAWEYQPLGPFLGKSFATSVSAGWIAPLDALAEAWVPAPAQDPPVLDYLRDVPHRGLDLALAVRWNGTVVGPSRRSPACTGPRRSSWRT